MVKLLFNNSVKTKIHMSIQSTYLFSLILLILRQQPQIHQLNFNRFFSRAQFTGYGFKTFLVVKQELQFCRKKSRELS